MLLFPVKPSQIPETEVRKSLLFEKLRDGVGKLWRIGVRKMESVAFVVKEKWEEREEETQDEENLGVMNWLKAMTFTDFSNYFSFSFSFKIKIFSGNDRVLCFYGQRGNDTGVVLCTRDT